MSRRRLTTDSLVFQVLASAITVLVVGFIYKETRNIAFLIILVWTVGVWLICLYFLIKRGLE